MSRWRSLTLALVSLAGLTHCSDGLHVVLGSASAGAVDDAATNPDAGAQNPVDAAIRADASRVLFGNPQIVMGLSSPESNDNPTLTEDLLEIFWISSRVGGIDHGDVWHALRSSVTETFGTPSVVTEVSSANRETSAAISSDGLTLWFASDRPSGSGTFDIWMSTRVNRKTIWSEPQLVTELNSPSDDIPRPPGQGGLVMPMASTRGSDAGGYQNYLAARERLDAPWGAPVRLTSLDPPEFTNVDGFLSDDGLTFYFNSDRPAHMSEDLFVATRPSTTSDFTNPSPLEEINTSSGERDPWVSKDGRHLFFASNRGGTFQIYEATR